MYKCHAGLVEAVIPLHDNEKIVGYLMFGQITDNPDKALLYGKIPQWEERYGIDGRKLEQGIGQIAYRSEEQIHAAAKIMEACTSYIIYKELITPESNKILEMAKEYIEEHLGEDIGIEELCRALKIGRTRLYEIFRQELNTGIYAYLLSRRMARAKRLLKTTQLSIPEIAGSVGFADYNYFSRVYKKTYGKSPKHYR
jgi:YesN/AraC family two-component response regulator